MDNSATTWPTLWRSTEDGKEGGCEGFLGVRREVSPKVGQDKLLKLNPPPPLKGFVGVKLSMLGQGKVARFRKGMIGAKLRENA
jgi:hypothetical protein